MEMKTYQIDCTALTDRDAVHDVLAQELCLPVYYGRNLDALYDCLTEFPACRILLLHTESLSPLGAYGSALLATLRDAAQDNPLLTLIEGDEDSDLCMQASETSEPSEGQAQEPDISPYLFEDSD